LFLLCLYLFVLCVFFPFVPCFCFCFFQSIRISIFLTLCLSITNKNRHILNDKGREIAHLIITITFNM
jgi:hypothetical protein